MTPEQNAATVLAVHHSIEAAEAALSYPDLNTARTCLSAAKASLDVLLADANAAMPEGEEEQRPASDDPATCGHPNSWDLGVQKMCETCGASRQEDGSWAVL